MFHESSPAASTASRRLVASAGVSSPSVAVIVTA
jgi:hypothetical protein